MAEWAWSIGVHLRTVCRWFREEKVPVPVRGLESGAVWVDVAPVDMSGRVVLCARVSSRDQRADLDGRVARVTLWATAAGREVGEVVGEVGSGLDGKRPGLRRILSGASVSVVVVEHRDRLAGFGVEHLEATLAAHGRTVVVADPGERVSV